MDNKYANLPGIAKNEPDFYETSASTVASSFNLISTKMDLTDSPSESSWKSSGESNCQHIKMSDAKDKYNASILSSEHADFSDTITNRRKFGYIVEPDIYEWNQDAAETPLHRFKRLELELNDLKADLTNMEKFAKEEDKLTLINFDPVELSKQVDVLQKEINALHLQKIGAKSFDVSMLDNKAKKQLLLDHLNNFKANLKTSKNEPTKVATDSSAISFKLFADLEEADLDRAKKVTELNSRLANLEKVFGAGNASVNSAHIAKLCTNIENKSILGLVENLNSKLSLLDVQSLEQIESKLQIVSQKVTSQLSDKKGVIEDQEKMLRINELYTMVNNWKDVSATVPTIVERLTALNEIHQKAFQFSSTLTRLDKEQQDTIKSIETSTDVLNHLKKSFETNLESIKANFDALNERILSIDPK
jgi:dynactin-2